MTESANTVTSKSKPPSKRLQETHPNEGVGEQILHCTSLGWILGLGSLQARKLSAGKILLQVEGGWLGCESPREMMTASVNQPELEALARGTLNT